MEIGSTENNAVPLKIWKSCGAVNKDNKLTVVNHSTTVTMEIIFRLHLREEYFIKMPFWRPRAVSGLVIGPCSQDCNNAEPEPQCFINI